MEQENVYIRTRDFLDRVRPTDAWGVMSPILQDAPRILNVQWLLNEAKKTSAYFQVRAIVTDLIYQKKTI